MHQAGGVGAPSPPALPTTAQVLAGGTPGKPRCDARPPPSPSALMDGNAAAARIAAAPHWFAAPVPVFTHASNAVLSAAETLAETRPRERPARRRARTAAWEALVPGRHGNTRAGAPPHQRPEGTPARRRGRVDSRVDRAAETSGAGPGGGAASCADDGVSSCSTNPWASPAGSGRVSLVDPSSGSVLGGC